MLKKILIVVVLVLVVIQFIRPEKNRSGNSDHNIATAYKVPENVNKILQASCADCHSNKTEYPWYAEIEPVGWWLSSHVKDGKRHLNLDNFTSMRIAFQKKRMEDCIEQLKRGDMPLGSYTLIHRYAILSNAQKDTLIDWCQGIVDEIKAKYPPDSLVLPKRRR